MKFKNIYAKDLKLLLDENVILVFYVYPSNGGYVLCAHSAVGVRTLASQRGGERVFRTLDAVFSFLSNLKVDKFEVQILDGEQYEKI